MTAGPGNAEPDSSLKQARRVHQACERFESAWREGKQPSIEDALSAGTPDDRTTLFGELLLLELELRRDRGETPRTADYRDRFPEMADLISRSFLDRDLLAAGSAPTAAWPGPDRAEKSPPWPQAVNHGARVEMSAETTAGGQRLGDYVLLEELARGGMGVVYKARHLGLKRIVALKTILSGSTATPAERARFRREAELGANLDHPNIVPIYEVNDQDGVLFFSMKLVDGLSLAQQIERWPRDPRAAARLLLTLTRAVHYAHGQGFIHCDLKPSNIMIDQDGQPRITDFGLARRTAEDSSITATGAILGTPCYMAPEQASGQRRLIGPATDVYGLGAILFELLTGRPPFRTATMMETVVQVLERDPVPPHELAPGVPRALETICLKCLEKLPEDRYASAQALADDLERYLQGDAVEATGAVQRLRRWTRREPELVFRLGGLALVALLTELNHRAFPPSNRSPVHGQVMATLFFWALSAVVFQTLWRRGWRSDRVGMFWATADLGFLTLALRLLNRPQSTLLVGYPLMIAASGLWFRVNLVWFTTALAVLGYLVLYFESAVDWSGAVPAWAPADDLSYANIYIASLVLTGFVVVRQVKRILALGKYFEDRQAR